MIFPLSFVLFPWLFTPFFSRCLFPLEFFKPFSVALSLLLQRLLHLCIKVRASRAHLLRVEPRSKARLVLILDHSRHAFKVSLRHHRSSISGSFRRVLRLQQLFASLSRLFERRKALNLPCRDGARPSSCCVVSVDFWLGLSDNDPPAHCGGWGEWMLFRILAPQFESREVGRGAVGASLCLLFEMVIDDVFWFPLLQISH